METPDNPPPANGLAGKKAYTRQQQEGENKGRPAMLRRLLLPLREFKRNAVIAPAFVALEVVMDVVIPYLMAKIIDSGIAKSDLHSIFVLGVLLLFSAGLSLVFGIMSGKNAAIASAGLAKNLRQDMFANIQTFSFANIDKFSPPSLITRLTTDVANVQNSLQMLLRIMIRSPLMLVFSLLMAFKINDEISLVFLAMAPVLGVGLFFIVHLIQPIFKRVLKTYDRLNTVVRENIRGIRVVKAYVREDFEIDKFKTVSKDIYADYSKAEKLLALNTPLMQFCTYTCMLLLAWLSAHLITAGGMTTGQLMGLITYATQILMSLMMLSAVMMMLTMSRASAERVVEVLDERTALGNKADPVRNIADASVVFEHVDFGYGGREHALALTGVDLSIAPGQTIGVIGGTGSGKSTLVQLIPRLYDATSGRVLVGGVDVRNYDLKTLRDGVAMVLQKNTLFSGTIRENLLWGNADASEEEMREAARLARADEFVEALPDAYESRVEQGGTNFSGGQRQRLCIARALLKNPRVLILDDSTSALDSRTDEEVREGLRDRLPGVTKFIIAQRIAQVMHADNIVVMEGGRVDAFATHDELMRGNKIYQEMYRSQIRGGDTKPR